MWKPDQLPDGGPLYVAIAEALADDVRRGRLHPGDKLPTHRDLARTLGVNVVTVTRGYAEAARRGLVEGEVGRGTFVRTPSRRAPEYVLQPVGPAGVDFNFNVPAGDPTILDAAERLHELADRAGDSIFTGYRTAGSEEHRGAGVEWLRRAGLDVPPERVLVTGGAQHGMSLAFAALCSPGDTVLAEAQTYPGMRALANVLHLRLAPVATDADGLLPDAVEAACRRGQARVLYCMPTMQNPTGTVMPLERREALVDIARKYGLAIVEDDTYGFLSPDPPPPLARLAPERCHFVTSMSKSLAAGVRIGFLAAPEEEDGGVAATERLAAHVTAIAWMAAPLMAELVRGWVLDGSADRLVDWKRRELAERRRIFRRRLGHLSTASDPHSSHLWLPLPAPWRSGELVGEARRRGVGLAPAEAFAAGRVSGPQAVRVCIGTPPTREDVEHGLATLATILERSPLASPSIV